jgi:tetraacyldisaccharide 4'-kinase
MREPGFWRRDCALARALAPAAMVYGAVAKWRMAGRGARAGVPVICVGNLTSGGAGKTPTAIAIARLLQAEGARPVLLTRGYRGRLAGPVQVAASHTAADVGDEALLLARAAPTVVARDRVAGAAAAIAAGASVIVMDDGFQNPALVKDCTLLVVDGAQGIGNGFVMPAGPLRAPLAAQLARARAVLIVGDAAASANVVVARARAQSLPVMMARLAPDAAVVAALVHKPVLAFAGIGNPEKFFATLAAARISATVTRAYPDHHRYDAGDASQLLADAARGGLTLVTTEKDLARMQGDATAAALARASIALPVTMTFDDWDALRRLLPRA